MKTEYEFNEYVKSLKSGEADAYIELDKDKEIAYMESHKSHFIKILNAIPAYSHEIKILDIGTTPFTFFIKKAYPHYVLASIDLTDLLEKRSKANGLEFRRCDLTKEPIPFDDNYFDIIIFTEVLEHLFAPPQDVFKEISRVLVPGGKCVIATPNFASLLNRLKLLFGICPMGSANNQMKRGWVHGYGHIREYTMKEVVDTLRICHFSISRKDFVSPLPDIRRIRNIYSLAAQVYHLLCFLIPSFRATLYIECHK